MTLSLRNVLQTRGVCPPRPPGLSGETSQWKQPGVPEKLWSPLLWVGFCGFNYGGYDLPTTHMLQARTKKVNQFGFESIGTWLIREAVEQLNWIISLYTTGARWLVNNGMVTICLIIAIPNVQHMQ
jgi:hypothetical protein